MQTALATSAFLMGLVGGPHCVAMCGPLCAGVIRIARAGPEGAAATPPGPALSAMLQLHGGRIAGYAVGGALAATAVTSLALASVQVAALKQVWMLFHAFVFAWGSVLLVGGRQPRWSYRTGGWLVARLRPLVSARGRLLSTGVLWLAMPCGLLYSALMLASLGNGPVQGAVAMALFGVGSTLSLLLAPWLWQHLKAGLGPARQAIGTRVPGLLLVVLSLRALWTDLMHQVAAWCA